jgi:hypothetical protein
MKLARDSTPKPFRVFLGLTIELLIFFMTLYVSLLAKLRRRIEESCLF